MTIHLRAKPGFGGTSVPAPETRPRDLGFEIVRICATYMVIILHLAAPGFFDLSSPRWSAFNVWDSMMRPCVPLFFMMTGALLLSRPNEISDVGKRVNRMLFPLVFWSAAYLVWFRLSAPNWLQPPDLWAQGVVIISGPVTVHFWYLYTLLGAYFALPVLRAVSQASRPVFIYVVAAGSLAAFVIPSVSQAIGYSAIGIDLAFFYWPGVYLLLGSHLANTHVPVRLLILLSAVFVATGFATAGLTYRASVVAGRPVETFYAYNSVLVSIGSVSGFIALRNFGQIFAAYLPKRIIRKLAGTTFGIYIIHMAVLYLLSLKGITYNLFTPWLSLPIIAAIVFMISCAIVMTLQMVPGMRRILPD
jgi:surface polysaccharide O-acyltransferase-like enzyme